MADLADIEDVANLWRPLSNAEQNRAGSLIRFASAYVREEVPDVDARIVAGTLQSDTARGIVAAMVQRVLMNPDGVRQRSRSIDDYQESETVDTAISSGELQLTDLERKRLAGTSTGRDSAVSRSMAGAWVV